MAKKVARKGPAKRRATSEEPTGEPGNGLDRQVEVYTVNGSSTQDPGDLIYLTQGDQGRLLSMIEETTYQGRVDQLEWLVDLKRLLVALRGRRSE